MIPLLPRLALLLALALLCPAAVAEDGTCDGDAVCGDTMPCEALGAERCGMVRDEVDEVMNEVP